MLTLMKTSLTALRNLSDLDLEDDAKALPGIMMEVNQIFSLTIFPGQENLKLINKLKLISSSEMYGGDLIILSCACGILCNISCNNSYKKLDVIGLDGIPTIFNTIIGKIIILFLTFVFDDCKNFRE